MEDERMEEPNIDCFMINQKYCLGLNLIEHRK
jgi:hypothetical protein